MATAISRNAFALLAYATFAQAQFGGPPSGSNGGNPYGPSGSDGDGDGDGNPFSNGFDSSFFTSKKHIVIGHAVLATVAFGFLFPVGGILIRLASFKHLWLVHGLFQIMAYIFYLAAAALGVYIARHTDNLHEPHAIIGLALVAVVFVEPILGLLHHFAFKQYHRRVVWSYAHIWIGRTAITLGIVNGGLGLQLAKKMPFFAPNMGQIIGYAVGAGAMWVIYVLCSITGEIRRNRGAKYSAVDKAEKQDAYEEGGAGAGAPPRY